MLVDVGEVDPEPEAFNVSELQVAVGDVPPGAVPGGEHIGPVGVVVRRSHRDSGYAGDRVEEKVNDTSLVWCLELGEIFLELSDGALAIGSANAPRAGIVERRDADTLAEARQHRTETTREARIPDPSSVRRETSPPSVVPPTWIDEPSH